MTVVNTEFTLPVKTGIFVKFHSGGKILINQPRIGDDVAVVLPSGELLKWLHGKIQFYENLRVRDIFQLLLNYPEVVPIFPSFANAVKGYKNLPSIGCCDQNVSFVGLKKEQIVNLTQSAKVPYTDSLTRLCIKHCDDPNGDDDLFWHDDPALWLDMKFTPLRSVVELIDIDQTTSIKVVEYSYTVYDLLDALNYSLENEIKDF